MISRQSLAGLETKRLNVEPGSSWENSYYETFCRKIRDKCFNGNMFYIRQEAKVVIEQ